MPVPDVIERIDPAMSESGEASESDLRARIQRVDSLLSQYGANPPLEVLTLATAVQEDLNERFPGLTDEDKFRLTEFMMEWLASLSAAGVKDVRLDHACWACMVTACRYAAPLRPALGLARQR